MLMMMMMNRGYKVQQSAPTYDVINRCSSNDKLTAKCKMSLFFSACILSCYWHWGTHYLFTTHRK